MPDYKHIFFDLDHTLWDFETNSRETLGELHTYFELIDLGIDRSEFIAAYEEINRALWDQYSVGKIDKAVLRVLRFRRAFIQFGINDNALSKAFGEAYVDTCPRKGALMPGARELLDWLHGELPMCVITNGFSEVQDIKMKASGIEHFFDAVITSEVAGAKKPSSRIFEVAMKKMSAQADSGLMIGDNQHADIMGAANVGMDAIHLDVHDAHLGSPATLRVGALHEVIPWLTGSGQSASNV
jgi:putative hydrolase of the HAD superfamily